MTDINKVEYGEHLGYSEMFEWVELPKENIVPLGKLVQFDEKFHDHITLAKNTNNIVGITTINTAMRASNPPKWPYKYALNEFGDLYLKEETIAVAVKEYDSVNEFSYISTRPRSIHLPINNPGYNSAQEYIPRTNRVEWISVTILGKAIVEDNGKCETGKYCTLYKGNDPTKYGTVQPAIKSDKFKLYVMERLSERSILVYYIPQIYSNIK